MIEQKTLFDAHLKRRNSSTSDHGGRELASILSESEKFVSSIIDSGIGISDSSINEHRETAVQD